MVGTTQIDPFSLRFRNNETLEAEFQTHFADKYKSTIFKVGLAACIIWLLLIISDAYLSYQDPGDLNFYVGIRLTSGTISLLSIVLVHHSGTCNTLQWTVGFTLALFGSIAMGFGFHENTMLAPSVAMAGLVAGAMSTTLFRLRFVVSTSVIWAVQIVQIVLTALAPMTYENAGLAVFVLAVFVVSSGLFTLQSYRRERTLRVSFLAASALEHEEARTQRILAQMLPASIIVKLRSGVKAIYSRHSDVSILFTNLHDFDRTTARLSAHAVVALLNELFSFFDQLTDQYNVYKVETIGDVYLISAGCPDERPDHAAVLCFLALDMLKAMPGFQLGPAQHTPPHSMHSPSMGPASPRSSAPMPLLQRSHSDPRHSSPPHFPSSPQLQPMLLSLPSSSGASGAASTLPQPPIELRVGIHSGPVIAGVVGLKYPRYRLMGDTVNTASRMSTTCWPGRCQLTTVTHALISPPPPAPPGPFITDCRGELPIKGKGLMITYWLLDVADHATHAAEALKTAAMMRQVSSSADDQSQRDVPSMTDSNSPAPPSAITSTSTSPLPGQRTAQRGCVSYDSILRAAWAAWETTSW